MGTADTDFGHVPADTAKAEAKIIANEEGKTVTLRGPITDKMVTTVKPAGDAAVSRRRP